MASASSALVLSPARSSPVVGLQQQQGSRDGFNQQSGAACSASLATFARLRNVVPPSRFASQKQWSRISSTGGLNNTSVVRRAELQSESELKDSLFTPSMSSIPPGRLNAALGDTPMAEIIDGKAIAKDIRTSIGKEVAQIKEKVGKVPGLAVVLVGNRTDSATYVRSKKKACEEVGIASFEVKLAEEAAEEEVLESVREFNSDPAVHGILVQLPLPKHISEETVIAAIDVEKDVDGFHPLNVGRLASQGRTPFHVSCTPKGCIELLLRSGVTIKGKHAVVIGRSNVIGMPVAILLQRQNATVTVVHSHTPNSAEVTRRADIVIAAVGVAELVRGDWIKPGAVVIDVGINSVEDPKAKKGYRLVGDVCYQEASQIASKITPVPGGVGPMTIAMLLSNTLDSAKRSFGLTDS